MKAVKERGTRKIGHRKIKKTYIERDKDGR